MPFRVKKTLIAVIIISTSIFAIILLVQEKRVDVVEETIVTPSELDTEKTVDEYIRSMTMTEKVGQMLLFGYWGENSTEELISLIQDKLVGSIILLNSNIGTTTETRNIIRFFQKSVGDNYPRLFISVDQEGGSKSRFPEKELKAQYEIFSLREAYETALSRGNELLFLGVNINFSPVLENISDPDSFMYQRVFRVKDELIGVLGASMVNGYLDAGIIPVIKHFPGHRNNSLNSHNNLSAVHTDTSALMESIFPFKYVIQNTDIDIIMMSHVLYPDFDNKYPASISQYFVSYLLRDELKFDGVIITDDMNMGAITKEYKLEEAAIQAINAGNDILLYVTEPRYLRQVHQAILDALESGTISEARINESLERILRLKKKYNLL